ncbi:hypothetical protein BD309DRAFT_1046708 [Dichomitus squalens]|uniref:Uncharacterized protein n=1 Tax=Dichomitus squalens TaxID=114155 RepID=A0A4Q9PCT9_9APHY|nr:hypothetical protein BD309DRAFT_1046708 [Dichomitus squalens]TBU52644.1 hypothetical protein BD310DRAFT_996616 [Dichomitus squalens]
MQSRYTEQHPGFTLPCRGISRGPQRAPLSDIPSCTLAVSPSAPSGNLFTVRKLIRDMYDNAADLRLEDGERYVLTAVWPVWTSPRRNLRWRPRTTL